MIQLIPYRETDAARWDAFVEQSPTATFLHSRRFLSYHGNRFADCSLLFLDSAGRICGLLPAAADPDDPSCVVSHPGATYGGLLLSMRQCGPDVFPVLEAACRHYADAGFTRFLYKSVPAHLHKFFSQLDQYALWRMHANLCRRDVWSVLELRRPSLMSENRRRCLKVARTNGIVTSQDNSPQAVAVFHALVTESLSARHGVSPVHTAADMCELHDRFPDEIKLWLAHGPEGRCIAGNWIFKHGHSWHMQYAGSTEEGRALAGQDFLLAGIIDEAMSAGVDTFSFGSSCEQQGRVLNEGLLRYKSGFGAGALMHDFYELDLSIVASRAGHIRE